MEKMEKTTSGYHQLGMPISPRPTVEVSKISRIQSSINTRSGLLTVRDHRNCVYSDLIL